MGRFGSGWAWLVDNGGKLEIESTPNQDNPLMDGKKADLRRRRVGARLLPEVPEPPPRLHHRVVERGELGGGQSASEGLSRFGSGGGRAETPGCTPAFCFLPSAFLLLPFTPFGRTRSTRRRPASRAVPTNRGSRGPASSAETRGRPDGGARRRRAGHQDRRQEVGQQERPRAHRHVEQVRAAVAAEAGSGAGAPRVIADRENGDHAVRGDEHGRHDDADDARFGPRRMRSPRRTRARPGAPACRWRRARRRDPPAAA